MFRKFNVNSKTKVKSSVQRGLRTKIAEEYPLLAPYVDEIIPKKSQLDLIKCSDKISLYSLDNNILFFQHHDDALYPHLRIVHKFPQAFPTIQIDRGAIRFIISGANVACPGLTSAGGSMPEFIDKDKVVVINAEGKENAVAVGWMDMSTDEIKSAGKGIGVENVHYLGDFLWKLELD